jgi:hypothetical protein
MGLVSERLDKRGVFVANVISSATGPKSRFMRSVFKTIQQTFPSAEIYPTGNAPRAVQNVMIVATNGPDMTQAELRQRSRQRSIGINLSREITHYQGPATVSTAKVPILRDGKAPVNRLTAPLSNQPYVIQTTNTTRNRSRISRIEPAQPSRKSLSSCSPEGTGERGFRYIIAGKRACIARKPVSNP